MPTELLTELAAQVKAHPWWQARANLVLEILKQQKIDPPSPILDAGCGWGQTFEILEARGFRVTGLDISRPALEALDRPGRDLIEADLTRPIEAGMANRQAFRAVLALDIIEHVDDDRALVATLASLLAPGGILIINVPALPELFSEFDQANGHRRRYTPETLRAAFDGTQLTLERIFYWNAWALPLFSLTRRRSRQHPEPESPLEIYRRHLALPPGPFPWLFRQAFAFEQSRALGGSLRRGTSLMAVARCSNNPTH
jgi:SAM-dependent methyltransferase